MNLRLRVPEGRAVRADRFLAEHLPDLSRRQIQRLLADGRIRVSGRRLRKGDSLAGGAELVVSVEAPEQTGLAPEPEPPIPILYEDRSLIALDKPAGRPAHALGLEDRGTVANFLVARYPEVAEASESPLEAGLVHRLDTDTSGVLLAARSRAAWLELRRQFREHATVKRYLALAEGEIGNPDVITLPLEPDPKNRRRVRVARSGSRAARLAVTRLRPLARGAGYTLLEVETETGVMHQVRAHLAAIGHPFAGDRLYGRRAQDSFGRQMLHASAIEFTHPASSGRIMIQSPLASDFTAALAKLGISPPRPLLPPANRCCC